MKKLLASLLLVCLVFGMVACGSNADNAPAGGENDVVVDNQVETEPAEEVETEPADVPEEVETEVVEEVETPVEEVSYTYADLSQTMYAKSAVNVRDLPSVDGNRVGSLGFAQEVAVTGKCNETGWYRISYGDAVAYVSGNYLLNEKPEPQPVATAPAETPAETPAEPTVALEKAPWILYNPVYDEASDSVYYFYIEGNDLTNYHYGVYACHVLTENNGKTEGFLYQPYPMGTYAEGEIIMLRVYVAE